MGSARRFLALTILLGLQALPAVANNSSPAAPTHEGTEFWVVFQKNFRDFVTDEKTGSPIQAAPLELALTIAAGQETRGHVEIPGLGFRKEFTIKAGQAISIPIDSAAQLRSSEKIEQLGVHIVTDRPVVVSGINRRYQTTDFFTALPVTALGRGYRAACYRWLQNDLLAQIAIVATEDGTRVKIIPTVKTYKGQPAREPFEITLDRGQVYQIIARYETSVMVPNGGSSDLTGSLIESDKPVAVFSGHNCAYVPNIKTKAANHLVEQLPSIETWGKTLVIGTMAGRSSSVFRVIAAENETRVSVDGREVAKLNAGEFYENSDMTASVLLTADRPVQVIQYSKGFDNGDNIGDPSMILVPPTEQYLTQYRFTTPTAGSWRNYLNVIAPTASIDGLRVNGKSVPHESFVPLGDGTWSVGAVSVPAGGGMIEGEEPFGVYGYGLGYDDMAYDAYGVGGMQQFRDLRGDD